MKSTNFIVQLNRDRASFFREFTCFVQSYYEFHRYFLSCDLIYRKRGSRLKEYYQTERRSSATGQAVFTLRPNYAAALLPRIMEKFIADKLS